MAAWLDQETDAYSQTFNAISSRPECICFNMVSELRSRAVLNCCVFGDFRPASQPNDHGNEVDRCTLTTEKSNTGMLTALPVLQRASIQDQDHRQSQRTMRAEQVRLLPSISPASTLHRAPMTFGDTG